MRFHFCGEQDCPDLVLSEVNTLSKVTSVRMRMLCSQVMKHHLGSDIEYQKLEKMATDAKIEMADLKASIAALDFIFKSAARYDVSDEVLNNELQQLGLPKEHSTALCKVYGSNADKLKQIQRERSLKLPGLDSVHWRVDQIISSSQNENQHPEGVVQIKLNIKHPDLALDGVKPVAFSMSKDQLTLLVHELRDVRTQMSTLEDEGR